MKALPKSFRFPGGFVCEIAVAPLRDAEDFGEYETLDISRGRITISSKLTPRQQWHFLGHEMVHATVDAQHYISQEVAP